MSWHPKMREIVPQHVEGVNISPLHGNQEQVDFTLDVYVDESAERILSHLHLAEHVPFVDFNLVLKCSCQLLISEELKIVPVDFFTERETWDFKIFCLSHLNPLLDKYWHSRKLFELILQLNQQNHGILIFLVPHLFLLELLFERLEVRTLFHLLEVFLSHLREGLSHNGVHGLIFYEIQEWVEEIRSSTERLNNYRRLFSVLR